MNDKKNLIRELAEAAYSLGIAEGRAAAYAEIVAMLREKWPTSRGASWEGLEAAVVERVIDEIEARAKEQSQ